MRQNFFVLVDKATGYTFPASRSRDNIEIRRVSLLVTPS